MDTNSWRAYDFSAHPQATMRIRIPAVQLHDLTSPVFCNSWRAKSHMNIIPPTFEFSQDFSSYSPASHPAGCKVFDHLADYSYVNSRTLNLAKNVILYANSESELHFNDIEVDSPNGEFHGF